MQILYKWFYLLAACASLASCATTPGEEVTLEEKLAAQGFVMGEQIRSIRSWKLENWTYVDDYHFIMHSGGRDRYLISLHTPSTELRYAVFLGFSKTAGSLTDMDQVIVRYSSGRSATILIDKIYELQRVENDQ